MLFGVHFGTPAGPGFSGIRLWFFLKGKLVLFTGQLGSPESALVFEREVLVFRPATVFQGLQSNSGPDRTPLPKPPMFGGEGGNLAKHEHSFRFNAVDSDTMKCAPGRGGALVSPGGGWLTREP